MANVDVIAAGVVFAAGVVSVLVGLWLAFGPPATLVGVGVAAAVLSGVYLVGED